MKKHNQSLKNIITAGIFAGAILGFPKHSGANPSTTISSHYTETIQAKYGELMQNLQEGLEDNFLDINEQRRVSYRYDFVRELNEHICPEVDITEGNEFYQQLKRYVDLLDKNVNGLDFGQPELEKELHKKGLPDIKVESVTSNSESILYGIIGFGAVTGSLIGYVRRKR